MSFGAAINEVLALIQLSWAAVEGAGRACGENDDLTKELLGLYDVLAHVYSELSASESIACVRRSWKAELQSHLAGCDTQLRVIAAVLDKFNALTSEQRRGKQLWSKVRFRNGEEEDLVAVRSRMATYSTAITMLLRLMSLSSRGKAERRLSHQKGSLEGIRVFVNLALAKMSSTTRHQSLIMAYSNDSRAFWSRLRHELTKNGFPCSAVNSKKDLIISYLKELDSRGVTGYSASFLKAMKAKNEVKRSSNTPASFQSSSTLTGGRNSNSSIQSLGILKDSGYCSTASDKPTSIHAESGDTSWPDSRPITAVEHEPALDVVPAGIKGEPKNQGIESPNSSIPCRFRHESDPPVGPRTRHDESAEMPTPQSQVHSPSHQGSIGSLSGRRSTSRQTEQKIRFEDPQGREFSFPLAQAKTWEEMESLIKKNCAGMGSSVVDTRQNGANLFPCLWEEICGPGAKLTIRRPSAHISSPSVSSSLDQEFYLLPERPPSPEEDFSHLPTLRDWVQSGRTEITPHSEFYEMYD